MNDIENDILIAEPEEEIAEEQHEEQVSTTSQENKTDKSNLFEVKEYKREEDNKTVKKEADVFVNYNFNNLNKVYKKYDVVQTYVPKKQDKPKQNKQFEKFVTEQTEYVPEKETVTVEKPKEKQKFQFKPKARAWLVSILVIFVMLGGLAIYNAVNINNLNNQITQTTTSINNINNDIKQVVKNIDELTDEDSVLNKANEIGLEEVKEENKINIELNEKNEVKDYESQTNFFDKICNFFRNLFGG